MLITLSILAKKVLTVDFKLHNWPLRCFLSSSSVLETRSFKSFQKDSFAIIFLIQIDPRKNILKKYLRQYSPFRFEQLFPFVKKRGTKFEWASLWPLSGSQGTSKPDECYKLFAQNWARSFHELRCDWSKWPSKIKVQKLKQNNSKKWIIKSQISVLNWQIFFKLLIFHDDCHLRNHRTNATFQKNPPLFDLEPSQ